MANFPKGGNGVEDYPHIVHEIMSLGDQTEGMMNVTLPSAWDGDDLTLMLIHELPKMTEVDCCDDDSSAERGGFLSSVTIFATLAIITTAAIFNRK